MQLRARKPKLNVPTPTLFAVPSHENAYTKPTTPSKVNLCDIDLEKTLTEALRSYVNGTVKEAFDTELQNQLTEHLLQSGDPNFDFRDSPTKKDKRVSVLDIVQREIDRFYDDFRKGCRIIVRLDGSAGRMTAMAELLWRLIGHPVPYQICVDIDKETVELHHKNPLVYKAVHSDVYEFLESNHFEEALSHCGIAPQTDSKKISIYLDFCRLPEGCEEEKYYPKRYDYNIRRIQLMMQKYPEATIMISYSMRLGSASPKKKSTVIWEAKLHKSGIELQKVKSCKENKFRTEYLTWQDRPRLVASKRKSTSSQAVSDFKSPQAVFDFESQTSSGLTPHFEQWQFDAERPRKKPRTPIVVEVIDLS